MEIVNFKIVELHIFNFKGFDDVRFSFGEENCVILGGKNGFGKTTIFDAIQLVLTGRIKRYEKYRDTYSDKRLHSDSANEFKPLVHNPEKLTVQIDLYLKVNNQNIILTRKADTSQLTTPINFKVFNPLYFRQKESDELFPLPPTIDLNIPQYFKDYDFINYLEQEESLDFIKQTEKSRAEKISTLFNTSSFDEPLSKIKKIADCLKKWQEELKNKRENIKAKKELLDKQNPNDDIESDGYISLFPNEDTETIFEWDKPNPSLSFENYKNLLANNGVLSNIEFWYHNSSDYYFWITETKSKSLYPYLEDMCFFGYWSKYDDLIKNYDYYRKEVLPHNDRMSLSNIDGFRVMFPRGIDYDENLKKSISNKQKIVISLAQNASNLERAHNEIVNSRKQLYNSLHTHKEITDIKECPLCGFNYENQKSLFEAMDIATDRQKIEIEKINAIASKEMEEFKQMVESELYNPIKIKFNECNLSEEVCNKYFKIDKNKIITNIRWLQNTLKYILTPSSDIEKEEVCLKSFVDSIDTGYNKELDYELLSRIYESYIKYIPKELLTYDNIKKKRNYLISQWNKKVSERKRLIEEEERNLENENSKFECFKSNLLRLEEDLKKQKVTYINRIISDIKILFYIYSGRILQDSRFGRGLFIKYNATESSSTKYIRFVDKYNSDIDVLYRLSSGQLVAMAIALTLSINKLYSKCNFIAIDDPIQTIDDINIWGLIETIRHEFKHNFMLLSTHELDYGALMRYKFNTVGINAKYYDMLDLLSHNPNSEDKPHQES